LKIKLIEIAAMPFSKFLKILKKLFEKSFLSGWRAVPSSTSAEVEISLCVSEKAT